MAALIPSKEGGSNTISWLSCTEMVQMRAPGGRERVCKGAASSRVTPLNWRRHPVREETSRRSPFERSEWRKARTESERGVSTRIASWL